MTALQLLILSLGAILAYAAARCLYFLDFHPLAKFPGPKIAAVSNIWYAYHWLSGRYPWATEDVLKKYVRIAPNDLLFVTPQAFTDIYSPHVKNHETFCKTDINDRGDEHGGLLFERDPVRHRKVAKQMSPAFSSRSMKAKEPRLHKHIDFFVEKMKVVGYNGVDISMWCNWLAMDISADMAYNHEMHQMRDSFNAFTTIEQVSKRFPILGKFKYLFIPFSAVRSMKEMNQTSREELQRRISRKGNTEDLDLFEQLVPADGVVPSNPKEFRHLEMVATQLLFAGFEPISSWYFSTLLYLLKEPETLKILVSEIRGEFTSYDDIKPNALASFEYLNACLEESMRLFPSNNTGLPRVSPGSVVDGTHVPRGVHVQTSLFAATRSPRNFHDPLHFRPQRWLDAEHPSYDSKFSKDNLKAFLPFSQGPRLCPGKEIAWTQTRLFIAKVLWTFDITKVTEKDLDFEKDFITYGFWVKPELIVRFVPRQR
ncbi:hypothetical protein DL769_001973 [Monosporascus sp. CRB-8-3]|nr:hypothetical protein DL769_001973 [Monosporascus sp. CRB-8-3]